MDSPIPRQSHEGNVDHPCEIGRLLYPVSGGDRLVIYLLGDPWTSSGHGYPLGKAENPGQSSTNENKGMAGWTSSR